MLLSQQLDADRDESGASKLSDGQRAVETWRCPSCRDVIKLEQQMACSCGYRVCQPCWQIAANFGGQCPTCGCPPDVESVSQRTTCGGRSSSRGDRSTSSSIGSTISRSNTPCQEPPPPPPQSQVHHHYAKPVSPEQLTVSADHLLPQFQQQQQQPSVFIRGADRRVLQNLRVIQRTLVYAIGLSPNFAQASTLKQLEYFGQYGEITKLVINHHQGVSPDDPRYGSASAYITFRRKEDAWAAICSVDGFRLMGRTIRASFGTTKYCNSFLRNLPCNNPECLYLHELGDEGDRFTKDEVQLGLARHGSSFAFKEEVLGDRTGGSNPRGSRSCLPQPKNPVLPPPCPMTPPTAYKGGLSNGVGGPTRRGPAPPPQSSPHTCRSVVQHATAVPGIGGEIGLGGNGRWAGGAPQGSPLQIGADGQPRPRRRRGQRGRRGSGGVGVGGGGGNSNERVFGPGGMGLTAPTIDIGIGGSGGPVLARTLSIPVPPLRPMVNDCDAGRYSQGVASLSLDSAIGPGRATPGSCAVPGMTRPLSASSGVFTLPASSKSESATVLNLERFGGGMPSGDPHHSLPKQQQQQQSWSGSNASSCRSTPVSGSYGGRSYWIKGRGSPLATPETLTNTPPVELSPSGPYSPPPALHRIADASQSLWRPSGFRDAVAAEGREDHREKEARAAAGGIYPHHDHLQLRAPPTFFGIGDGQLVSMGHGQKHQQQKLMMHEDSRVGQLVPISEFRQACRETRSRSIDLVLEQQQQQPRWSGGGEIEEGGTGSEDKRPSMAGCGGERASMAIASAPQNQRQRFLENDYPSYNYEGGKGGGVSLFTTTRSHGSGGSSSSDCDVAVGGRSSSSVEPSPFPPPGLSLVVDGRDIGGNRPGSRLGGSYSDDLSSCSDRLAALSWDDSGAGGRHEVASSLAFSRSRAASSFGMADNGSGSGDRAGVEPFSPRSFYSMDSFVASASQAEASQWRRATPKLFA